MEDARGGTTRGLIYGRLPVVVVTNLVTTMTPPRAVVVTTLLRLLVVACRRVKEVPERTLTIYAKVRAADPSLPEDKGCLALRAYYRLKRACVDHGIDTSQVRPDVKLAKLLPRVNRRERISAILRYAGFPTLPRMPFGLQFTSGHMRDYVLDCVISHHAVLRRPGMTWSREQVREVARAVLRAQLMVTRFSDDARFVQDLGVD